MHSFLTLLYVHINVCILFYCVTIDDKQSDKSTRCDNFMQFLNLLNQAQIKKEKIILVLDKCEMLEHEQILLFSKLQELLKSYTFCVILISQVSPAIFDEDIDFISILFEQYNSGNYFQLILLLLFFSIKYTILFS